MTPAKRKWAILAGALFLCAVAAILILIRSSGQLLKAHIERSLDENVKAGSVTISWGKVVIRDVTFLRDGRTVGTIRSVAVRADFRTILKDTITISKVEVEEPYFKLLIDKKGRFILPIAVALQEGKVKGKRGDSKVRGPRPVAIRSFVARGGTIDFEDRSVSGPVLLKFTDVALDVNDIAYPPVNQWTGYEVSSRLAGGRQTGSITGTGKTNLLSEQTKVRAALKNIDLSLLKPYIERKGDARIEGGFVTMTMDADLVKKRIRAPGTMVLRDLRLRSSDGVASTFLGVPASMVVAFLKDNNDKIRIDFILEGNLDNPRFKIRENLATALALGLAEKLGLSIEGVGEALATGSSTLIDKAAKTLKGIFKQ